MCLVYSIAYSEFVFLYHFSVFSWWDFADFYSFLADISAFSPCAAPTNYPALFLSVSWHLFVASCLSFFVFYAVFLQQPLSSFCSFILVKVVIYYLEVQFKFLFVLAICYCNQSMSKIFRCVHHFLISPVWKQQQTIRVIPRSSVENIMRLFLFSQDKKEYMPKLGLKISKNGIKDKYNMTYYLLCDCQSNNQSIYAKIREKY